MEEAEGAGNAFAGWGGDVRGREAFSRRRRGAGSHYRRGEGDWEVATLLAPRKS